MHTTAHRRYQCTGIFRSIEFEFCTCACRTYFTGGLKLRNVGWQTESRDRTAQIYMYVKGLFICVQYIDLLHEFQTQYLVSYCQALLRLLLPIRQQEYPHRVLVPLPKFLKYFMTLMQSIHETSILCRLHIGTELLVCSAYYSVSL